MTTQAYQLVDDIDGLRKAILDRPPFRRNVLGVDRQTALDAFSSFVECYDLSNPEIAHKRSHTMRVTLDADEIAARASLGEHLYADSDLEDGDVAGDWVPDAGVCFLSGLLHDVGRFPQYSMYRTYVDRQSFPHAEMSYDMLGKFGMLRRFIPSGDGQGATGEMEQAYLLQAVRRHSLFDIGPVGGEERSYCEILRDADRIDILEAYCHAISSPRFLSLVAETAAAMDGCGEMPSVQPVDAPFVSSMARTGHLGFFVSDGVLADLRRGGMVDKRHLVTAGDHIMVTVALYSGIHTEIAKKMLAERGTMTAIGEAVIRAYGNADATGTLVSAIRSVIGI